MKAGCPDLISNPVDRDLLTAETVKEFAFLVEIDDDYSLICESQLTRLRFKLETVFVEVELDWREGAVFVLVGELVEGQVPDGYYVDSSGRKSRWHLGPVLENGGRDGSARRLRLVSKPSGQRAMLDQLVAFSEELRLSIDELPTLIQRVKQPRGAVSSMKVARVSSMCEASHAHSASKGRSSKGRLTVVSQDPPPQPGLRGTAGDVDH